MNSKLIKGCGVLLALGAGLVALPALAETHTLLVAPGPHFVRITTGANVTAPGDGAATYTQFNCIATEYHGFLQMAFNQGCGVATGSTWRRGYVNLPWAPNPGSTESVLWSGTEPAGTKLAARMSSYFSDGTFASVEPFKYHGGLQGQFNLGIIGDGPMYLEVAMQSNATTTTPTLTLVGADVWSQ